MRFLLSVLVFLSVTLLSVNSQDNRDDLNKKIGQMIMVGFRGLDLSQNQSVYDDLAHNRIGGVILFDYDVPSGRPVRNIRSPEQLKELIESLHKVNNKHNGLPLFIAVDQEGGKIQRLKPGNNFPSSLSAEKLGEIDHADTTRYYSRQQAELLSELGFNVNFAPVVDLNTNPSSPAIGKLERSYSSDPEVVIHHAGIVIKTLKEFGIMPVLKHFPGHGSANTDSHLGITDVTATWQEVELKPYEILIERELIPAIMSAHIFHAELDSTYPATLSKPIIDGILRNRLNFNGIIISDDMQMKAVRSHYGLEQAIYRAICAGIDILLFANNSIYDPDIGKKVHTIIRKLVDEGKIPPSRIDSSFQRIVQEKKRLIKIREN